MKEKRPPHELFFDKWLHLYAGRTATMRSSEVRDLLAVTERPDIISLAGGLPYVKGLNMEKLDEALHEVIEKTGSEALQYGPSEGYAGLRNYLVKFMAEEGVQVTPDDIVITDGSQQAVELLTKIFVNPGDVILTEAPSYVGALNAFLSYQTKVVQIPLDDNGIKIDLLVRKIEELKRNKIQPKFIYITPNFHNPAGVTLSHQRRKKLIKLARQYHIPIIEDNAYSRLSFEEATPPCLKSIDPENVIYVGTFSKILSPGLRVGWVSAQHPILEKLIYAKQAADLCSSSLSQRLVEEYFKTNEFKPHIKKIALTYRKRRDAMLEALKEFFPKGIKWTKPKGGFFVWVTLPEYIDTTSMLAKAISEKVAYVPGRAFFADGSGKNYMRLNFSYPKEKDIKEGIRRLSEVIEQEIELYKSLKL